VRDAPHVQAFHQNGGKSAADDDLGAAAADVHHQAVAAAVGGQAVGNTAVDQACLLDAGDDLDRVAQRLFRAFEELRGVLRAAQGIRTDDAHVFRRQPGQALSKSAQALQRAFLRRGVHVAGLVEAIGQADLFAQAVDQLEAAAVHLRDDHVKTVRAEIDGGDLLGDRRWCGVLRHGSHGMQLHYRGSRGASIAGFSP